MDSNISKCLSLVEKEIKSIKPDNSETISFDYYFSMIYPDDVFIIISVSKEEHLNYINIILFKYKFNFLGDVMLVGKSASSTYQANISEFLNVFRKEGLEWMLQ